MLIWQMKHLANSKKEFLHEGHSFLKAFQTKLVFNLNLSSPSNLWKSNHVFIPFIALPLQSKTCCGYLLF